MVKEKKKKKWRKSLLQILDRSDIRWNVFLCSIYWSNIQKKYIKVNHSSLAPLKSHINRNVPTSFQSVGITETAERHEPTALGSPAGHSVECSVASCLGSLHTATISTSPWRKRHFFPPLLVLVFFSFQHSPEWRTVEGDFPSCQKMSFFFIIKPENKSKTVIIIYKISTFKCHSRPVNSQNQNQAIC